MREGRGGREWSRGDKARAVILFSPPCQIDSLDDGALRSHLTLTDITMSNGGRYVCNLDGAKSLSIPTTIEVENSKTERVLCGV